MIRFSFNLKSLSPTGDLAQQKADFAQEWSKLEPVVQGTPGITILHVGRFEVSMEADGEHAKAALIAALPESWVEAAPIPPPNFF